MGNRQNRGDKQGTNEIRDRRDTRQRKFLRERDGCLAGVVGVLRIGKCGRQGGGEREWDWIPLKNCTFFSPIEWPGRHLNTLCVFHPWG